MPKSIRDAEKRVTSSTSQHRKMQTKDFCRKECVLTVSGIITAIMGLVMAILWPYIFENILHEELKLSKLSRAYEPWKSPPFPLSLDIYFFNWTNPDDIYLNGTKPVLEELGPYRFTELSDKVDIVWNDENSTVSYRKKSLYYFDEEGSQGRLDDMVTTVNIAALSAAARAKHWTYLMRKGVSIGLTAYGQELSVTKTASELLFEGYEDDMVTMGKEMLSADDVPFDRVGFFYMRNNTPDLIGHYNMHTGRDNIHNIGQMRFWNYENRTNFYADNCGMLNGSAGELFPPNLSKDEPIQLFVPDMCRSLPFDYEEEQTVEGIKGYKYSGGARAVDNGTHYPDNYCFFPGENVPSGVMNISACRFGSPVFMSFPHFYDADPYYTNQVDGLTPEKGKHQFYMTLEPNTGIALEVAARIQLNVLLDSNEEISLFSGIQKTFLPVLWFEQKVSMKPEFADEISSALSVPITGTISFIVIFFIGLLMTFWFTCDAIFCKLLKRQQKISHTDQNISIAMLPEKFKEGDQMTDIKLVVEQHPLMTIANESEKQKGADENFVLR